MSDIKRIWRTIDIDGVKRKFYYPEHVEKLEARIAELEESIDKYENGYKGSCYACEPVGMLNVEQEKRIAELEERIANISSIKYENQIKAEGIAYLGCYLIDNCESLFDGGEEQIQRICIEAQKQMEKSE